jgi:hypothetical protein
MKKVLTLVAGLMMLSASAETLNLYEDADTYLGAVPFNSGWVDEVGNKTQVLFPAADLTAMVGQQIKAITFYTEPEGCTIDGGLFSISLGEIAENTLNDYVTEGLTQVGTCTFTKHEGEVVEFTITFDTPYLYNGGNLLFENVVVEATNFVSTYWTGIKTNYNCAVVGSYGSASARQFLPKTTFTYGEGGDTPEPQVIRGDVDGNEVVAIADVTVLIDLLLKNAETPAAADCNLDGTVGIADVTVLIDYLLGGNWPN